MIFLDKKVEESSFITIRFAVIILIMLLFFNYISLVGLFNIKTLEDLIFNMIGFVGTSLYLINTMGIFYNGPKIVNKLMLENDKIIITNSLNRTTTFHRNDLVDIKQNYLKWFLGCTPTIFRNKKPYFSINFQNKKVFVISPHMKEIAILHEELKKISEFNRNKTHGL